MITTTMSIKDKCYEALRACNMLYAFHIDNELVFRDRLMKKTSSAFPYYNRFTFIDDKHNEWHFLYICKNKEWRRKGVYLCCAYLIFEVPPMRKENQTNSGKGFISYNPDAMGKFFTEGQEYILPPFVYEVVPHAMNRYNERFLKPNGLDGIDFTKKVEMILADWINFDVEADLHGDKSTKKHIKEDTFPYDVTIKNKGTLKGTLYPNLQYVQFHTFISKDIMYEDQTQRHKTMTKEYYQFYNPTNMQKNHKK